jgi:hypothetical protein
MKRKLVINAIHSRKHLLCVAATLIVAAVLLTVQPGLPTAEGKGAHYGEEKMIDATIEFFAPIGTCVADDTGLHITIQGNIFFLDTVYDAQYWGEYPVYFPNTTVPVGVWITNNGPRSVAKHDLVTEAFLMNTDGSNGEALIEPVVQTIEVERDETVVIDATFLLPEVSKGLNRFTVSLYHHYNPDSNEASKVLSCDAIFCPPEMLE